MAKPLSRLRKQFAAQGWRLLFSFDTTVSPGSIVELKRARDLNNLSSIFKYPAAKDVAVLGPADVGLLDFTRAHQLTLDAAATLLGGAGLKPKMRNIKTATLSLDRPMKWYIEDKIELFSTLAGDPDWPASAYAERLAMKKHYLVTEVVKTTLRYTFHGLGDAALTADATGLRSLRSVKLHSAYEWDNQYELTAKAPLVIAYEAVQWRPRKGIFRTLKAR
jgi:hypothetical protein